MSRRFFFVLLLHGLLLVPKPLRNLLFVEVSQTLDVTDGGLGPIRVFI